MTAQGRKRLDDRRGLNGIVWKFRAGTARRDAPGRYGSRATLRTCFRRWAEDGTFAAGDIDWPVSADSAVARPIVATDRAPHRKVGRPDQQDPPGLRFHRRPLALVATTDSEDVWWLLRWV